MPGFMKACSLSVILFACALILLVIVSISLPTFRAVDFTRVKSNPGSLPVPAGAFDQLRLGIWGSCQYNSIVGSSCIKSGHGYSFSFIDFQTGVTIRTVGPSWTRGLAIHPVAALVTFLSIITTLLTSRNSSPSPSLYLVSLILPFVATFLTLLAFICDIALLAEVKGKIKDIRGYSASSAPGFWITFVALWLVIAASLFNVYEKKNGNAIASDNEYGSKGRSGSGGSFVMNMRRKIGY